jgi:alkanesulfonate monooxygenase SsuD/methylene tetrahydromethanopterin reductase-like flavin-dependent oxidoreductase (luciferase family)
MSSQRLGVMLPESTDTADDSFAAEAESLGYESIWVGENWGSNAFLRLAAVARETSDIGIGTAITNVFSRSPATIAMTGANLDSAADGRFRLGVGPSSPALVENLHGMAFDRPVRRTHETVELIRELTGGGDTVTYDGELFEVDGFPPLDRSFPIYNAAIGAANRRATGRLCDGWLPHLVPFSRLPDTFETVSDAAEEAGRDPGEITIAPYLPAAVSEDPEEAREAISRHVAFYVGSSAAFRNAVAKAFPEDAEVVGTRWNEGDREGAVAAVTDDMRSELSVCGRPETAREQLRDLLDADLFDLPLLALPAGVEESLVDSTVAELAPARL